MPFDLEDLPKVPESVEVQLTKIDGKLDALAERFDNRMDLVLQKIESGDRESVGLFRLLEQEQGHFRGDIEEHDKRITNIATEKEREHGAMEERLERLETFRTQAKTIIALIVFLMPVITAIIIKDLNIS